MRRDDLMRQGEHVMTVCNACRYCEQYCPVFPAMERRLTFLEADLTYLANLCHNCGECLYACQYAPPHEFGINVPKTLGAIRVQSYEEYCWPRILGAAFQHHNLVTAAVLAFGLVAVMFGFTLALNPRGLWQPGDAGDFYSVVPHSVMVGVFGGVTLFILASLTTGAVRFWRDVAVGPFDPADLRAALRDVLTLRHLHGAGLDCPSGEELRTPWRRWFHHCTFYGFLLCFASTSVAAFYHSVFGWEAPHGYISVPVVLGTMGGVGLLVGPAGLLILRRRRDPALGNSAQHGLDESFLALLFLTSLTGFALMILRHQAVMGLLLIVHLGVVLALFVTVPYGKFVHGLYRTVALIKHAVESRGERDVPAGTAITH